MRLFARFDRGEEQAPGAARQAAWGGLVVARKLGRGASTFRHVLAHGAGGRGRAGQFDRWPAVRTGCRPGHASASSIITDRSITPSENFRCTLNARQTGRRAPISQDSSPKKPGGLNQKSCRCQVPNTEHRREAGRTLATRRVREYRKYIAFGWAGHLRQSPRSSDGAHGPSRGWDAFDRR